MCKEVQPPQKVVALLFVKKHFIRAGTFVHQAKS